MRKLVHLHKLIIYENEKKDIVSKILNGSCNRGGEKKKINKRDKKEVEYKLEQLILLSRFLRSTRINRC